MAKNSTIVLVAIIGGLRARARRFRAASRLVPVAAAAVLQRHHARGGAAGWPVPTGWDGRSVRRGPGGQRSRDGLPEPQWHDRVRPDDRDGARRHSGARRCDAHLPGSERHMAGQRGKHRQFHLRRGDPGRRASARADGRTCAGQCHDHSDCTGRGDEPADCGQCGHGREHRQRQRDDGGSGGAAGPGGQPMSVFSGVALTFNDATIRTVTLTIPSSGTVVANATGMFAFGSAATIDGAWCSITTGTTADRRQLSCRDGEQCRCPRIHYSQRHEVLPCDARDVDGQARVQDPWRVCELLLPGAERPLHSGLGRLAHNRGSCRAPPPTPTSSPALPAG